MKCHALSPKASVLRNLLVCHLWEFLVLRRYLIVLWPDNVRDGSGNVFACKFAVRIILTRIRTGKGHLLRMILLI